MQFDLSRNIDGAARDVQAAINAARANLPSNLPSNPTYRKVNPADAPIMIVALTSDIYNRGQLYDAASTIIQQRLLQIRRSGPGEHRRRRLAGRTRGSEPDPVEWLWVEPARRELNVKPAKRQPGKGSVIATVTRRRILLPTTSC